MAVQLVLRNGTSAENDAFTGATGEVTVDTTNNSLRVHDGSTAGGSVVGKDFSAGTGITLSGTVFSIGQAVGTTDNVTFNDITANGNVTLAGTTSSESGSNLIFDPDTQIVEIRGDGSSVVGQLQLNCHVNTHGQIIASQPHSENATNRLTLPGGDTIGNADATLVSDTGTQTLSDKTLSSPTFSGQVTGDLIPSSDVTFDLGSATNRWKDLFLSGNTLDIGGATISVVGGSFEFKDSGGNDAEVSLAANTTDDLAEGTTNLYAAQPVGTTDDVTFNSVTGDVTGTVSDISNHSTDDLSEGLSNLYYTDTRVRNAVSATGDLTYDSTTGAFGVTTYKTSDFDTDFSGKTSDDLSEGTTNLYYTDARVDAHLSGGTGVTFSNGVISVGQSVETTDNVTFNNVNVSGTLSSDDISAATVTASNDLIVQGNLTVQGTTTSTNSTEVNTTSATITLVDGLDENTAPSQDAGLVVNRGSSPDKTFLWNEGIDKWTLGTETLIAGTVEADVIGTVSDISNHDTDDLTEGASNLYFTDTRVRNAVSASGDLAYDSLTGTFSFTDRTDAEVRNLFSATGDLTYDSATGAFGVTTYKTADFNTDFSGKNTDDLSEGVSNLYFTTARVDAHLSGGNAIDFNAGTISVPSNAIGTDELNVAGTGSAGEALLSDGDGSFSFGAAGATITDDTATNSDFYPTLTGSTSGSFTAATVSSTKLFFNPSSGTLNATSFNSLSDERTKKNIETLDSALDKTLALRGVSYTFKDSEVDSIGLVAQELEHVIPEVVSTGDDGLKSVSYGNLVGLLVEAIKDQQNQIDDLKNKVYK